MSAPYADVVGVIGVGVIGTGVAQSLAQNGYQVIAVDVSALALERAWAAIKQNMRLYTMFAAGKLAVDADDALARLCFTTDYQKLAATGYVIENVTENWEIKRAVYEQIDGICASEVVFAANTSCIPITRIGSVTRRPAQVIGVHFMNPVPLIPGVEVIRGYHTSDDTVRTTEALLGRLGKKPIIVNDMPGFVSNRLMTFMINEAAYLVQEQVASPRDIDRILKLCYGHKMGPLETADLIGIDTILHSMEVLHESFNDSKFRPCPLLRKMVDAGLLGCKSGRGFYSYVVPDRAVEPMEELEHG